MSASPASQPEHLEQANRRLALLNQVATSLMRGETPEDGLNEAFAAVAGELGAKYYLHYRVDDAQPGELVLAAAGGLGDGVEAARRIRIGENTSGKVAQSREPLILAGVDARTDDGTARLRARGVRAYAAFPLLAHGVLLGTIAFGSTTRPQFAPEDIELLRREQLRSSGSSMRRAGLEACCACNGPSAAVRR